MATANRTKTIDEITTNFSQEFGSLNIDQLNWKPNSSTWSIAQNIEHLIVINETYFPCFQSLKDGQYKKPFLGKIGFLTNFFGNFILKSVSPETEKKIKTFPIWEPSKSEIEVNIIERFSQHQEVLKTWLTELEGVAAQGAVISSPANSTIVYKLSAAFDIIITHELRHLKQAKEILALQ